MLPREVKISPVTRRILLGAVIFVLWGMTVVRGREARWCRALLSDPAKIYFIPAGGWTKVITLGYNEAACDLAWIRALIYFGKQTVVGGRFRYLDNHIELILQLDPMFNRAYHWAGIASIYSEPIIKRRRVEKAIEYLKRGVEKFPEDGEMHYMLGFDLYFELPPFLEDKEEIRKVRLEGIDHFKAAVACHDRPEWLASLVSSLLKKNGLIQLAIRSIEESLKYIEDPETQKKLIERLKVLKGKADADEYERQMESLLGQWIKDYPYLSLDMYLLVKPRIIDGLPAFTVEAKEVEKAISVLDQLAGSQ